MSEDHDFRPLELDDTTYDTLYTRKFAQRKRYVPADPRQMRTRIPGLVLSVRVHPGSRVRRGESLLVLEAMKMRNEILAHDDGVIARVHVTPGQMVAKDELLIELE